LVATGREEEERVRLQDGSHSTSGQEVVFKIVVVFVGGVKLKNK